MAKFMMSQVGCKIFFFFFSVGKILLFLILQFFCRPHHPGQDVMMEGAGLEATQMFEGKLGNFRKKQKNGDFSTLTFLIKLIIFVSFFSF